MATITVVNSITLDGVMQAPGRADEDTRGGFAYGGWAGPYDDGTMAKRMGRDSAPAAGLLFGGRTYADFASVWPYAPADNPFVSVLNNAQKYVVSNSLPEGLPWMNSIRLAGDGVERVRRLKAELDGVLTILGSGELIRSLLPHGLIDDFLLQIHPLVLGQGRRLFAEEGSLAELSLVDSETTSTGVIIAHYRAAWS